MASSSWSATYPLVRRIALRSHCNPKISSRPPTTIRRSSIGTLDTAGPSAPTSTASAARAAPTPSSAERHPRVTPTASTIVSASTISTPLARKAVRKRKTPSVTPHGAGCSPSGCGATRLAPHGGPARRARAGVDPAMAGAAMRGDLAADHIVEDAASALASGVTWTPALFVDGERYDGELEASAVSDALRLP